MGLLVSLLGLPSFTMRLHLMGLPESTGITIVAFLRSQKWDYQRFAGITIVTVAIITDGARNF